jgi:Family of unknown function (DUF6523)
MATSTGFGKPKPKAPKVPSKGAIERAKASERYDKLKTDGMPEYEIYIRIQGKKNWFPVGVIAVKRSSQIHAAVFDNEAELLKGAFHIFPILKKNQGQLEYGYRLKEFKEDPIELAVRPAPNAGSSIQAAIAGIGDRISSLFKSKES